MANSHNYINQGDDNPWKGLNFYVEGETLYGRDSEIQRLTQFIVNNSQTVLYGKSGIGKSSIINAGIFPIARQQGLFPVPLRFGHSQQSNISYLEQIKEAFKESGIGINPLRDAIDKESESLWEFFHRHTFFQPETGDFVRPLVVFDQFEEIFTLQHNEAVKKEFFSQLADLINEVKPRYIFNAQYGNRISNGSDNKTSLQDLKDFVRNIGNDNLLPNYVEESLFNLVFVIREDYLSYFERYTAYIPAMKANRFPLLPLNEEQAAEIILKPREGLVSKEVAELIIQKITGTSDFKLDGIPEIEVSATMLSLYLSRLYLKKGDQETITAEMVNQFGDYIIKDFYEESIADLPQDEIEKLEDELITNGMRDNSFISYMTDKENNPNAISKETIETLVKCKLLRQYPDQKELRVEFMHDILCPVVNERIEQRESAKKEEAERKRQEEEKARILREEEEKRKAIERQAEQERQRHEQETRQIKKRNRRRVIISASLLAAALVVAFTWYQLFIADYSCNYADFTTVNGWPKGLEKINPDDKTVKDNLIVYYRLTRKGRLNIKPFYKVEVMSAYDHKPTTNKFIESPAVGLWSPELSDDQRAAAFADLQRRTIYWIYSTGEQGAKTAGKCTAFGLNKEGNSKDKELYSIQFNRDNTTSGTDVNKYVQWAVYYDASGKQMTINDKGIDRMRQTINNGIVTSCVFFSMLGVPQQNERGAYGYQYDVDNNSLQLQKVYRVNKFGNMISDTPITYMEYEFGRTKKTSLYEVNHPQPGMIVRQYKDYSDTLEFYPDGRTKHGSFHPDFTRKDSIISFSKDKHDRVVFKNICSNGQTVKSEIITYKDNTENPIEIKKTENGFNYSERYSYPNDSTIVMEFYQNDNKVALYKLNEKTDELCYHKCVSTISPKSDPKYIIESKEYYDTDGSLIQYDPSEEFVNQYSKFKVYKDRHSKNILFEYYYDSNDDIQKSELFDYDSYGNLVAKAVAGVDFNPVRCIDWSWYGLCCYKMAVLSPFYSSQSVVADEKGVFASMVGINEFGEESLILGYYNGYLCQKAISESRMGYFSGDVPTEKKENRWTIQTGFKLSETEITPCDMKLSAYFIHILSKKGTCSQVNLKDGDIVIKIDDKPINSISARRLEDYGNCRVEIARPHPEQNSYEIKQFTIPEGNPRIHVDQIQLTAEEYKRLSKSIK